MAYKKTLDTFGNSEQKDPSYFGLTPSDFTVQFSGAERATVSDDDDNYVEVSLPLHGGYTVRGNILLKFQIDEAEELVTVISQLLRGASVGANTIRRIYIWNFVTTGWVYLGSLSGYSKSTHESFIGEGYGGNPADYINDDGVIYVLYWDWYGDYYTAEGCFPSGTEVRLLDGSFRSIEQLELGDKLVGWHKYSEKPVLSLVTHKATYESLIGFSLYRVEGPGYSFLATGDHEVYTDQGKLKVEKLTKDHKLLKLENERLELVDISNVEVTVKKLKVYDISTSTANFLLKGDILVHNALRIMKW